LGSSPTPPKKNVCEYQKNHHPNKGGIEKKLYHGEKMKDQIELELKDWLEMEQSSIETIRTAEKMEVAGYTTLNYIEDRLKSLGHTTERERLTKARKEQE